MKNITFLKKAKTLTIFFAKVLTKRKKCDRIIGRLTNGPLVKRLRHGPLKAETGVRFSHGSPNKTYPNYFVTDKWFGFVFYINIASNYT